MIKKNKENNLSTTGGVSQNFEIDRFPPKNYFIKKNRLPTSFFEKFRMTYLYTSGV